MKEAVKIRHHLRNFNFEGGILISVTSTIKQYRYRSGEKTQPSKLTTLPTGLCSVLITGYGSVHRWDSLNSSLHFILMFGTEMILEVLVIFNQPTVQEDVIN
jgi:hypothetical protein